VTGKPIITLRPSQGEFFAADAYIQAMIACRQWGKDFTTACKSVRHAIRTGQPWYIISTTQRQADETFKKCQWVAEIYREFFARLGDARTVDGEPYLDIDPETAARFTHRARTLHFPGVEGATGGSVTSLPGRNPDTIAGYTGNVILTEFALFPRGGYDHWRVIFPVTTGGYRVIIITTPRGKNTKAYEVVHKPSAGAWVRTCDVYQGVAEGMPLYTEGGEPRTLEEFRAQYGDPVGWKRDYELEWTGDLEALLKWAQLAAAGQLADGQVRFLRIVRDAGWQSGFFADLKDSAGRPEMGWDVARHKDLSVLWVNVAAPGKPRRLSHLAIMHDSSFGLQRTVIREAMDSTRKAVGCGDATGLGMDSNETLSRLYGARWVGHTFTVAGKREIGSLLRTAFDDADQAIPDADGEHRRVALDLYAVQREGDGDQLKLIEGDNPDEPDSHCDIAYAGGLARKAATIRVATPYVSLAG
jgi:phage FluMu gp28-like protein